ncbi:MAG: hypothetical protein ACC608_04825 [Anaerofustis sp.]
MKEFSNRNTVDQHERYFNHSALPYFKTKTSESAIEMNGSLSALGGYFNASGGRLIGNMYGVCDTAAATTAKTVAISGFELVTGALVTVQFTYAVPASATLNINGTGAKAIYHGTTAIVVDVLPAGSLGTFVFDGTYFRLVSVGSPTGIMEIGSNTNGSYCKWFNGLMVCFQNGVHHAMSAGHNEWSLTFPQTFSGQPVASIQAGWPGAYWGANGFNGCQTSTTAISFGFDNGTTEQWVWNYGYIAIGRWK